MKFNKLIGELAATYKKFGFTLRRVLLKDETRRELLGELEKIGAADLVESAKFNALWFSRTTNGRETWELRLLHSSPFALLESFDTGAPEAEREKMRRAIEARMAAEAAKFTV